MSRGGLERSDRELLRVLDRDFDEARRRAGAWLVCAPGCADCCHGPFPVTRLDAWRLGRGLAELDARDPALAQAIRDRADRCIRELSPAFPGDPDSGRLTQDEKLLDGYFERHAALACPVLDPLTRRCDLYAWRPVSCRTYGPPVRFGQTDAPPCDLCFRGAPPTTVERCRIEPDRHGLEEAILERRGDTASEDWETLIAFALRGRASGRT